MMQGWENEFYAAIDLGSNSCRLLVMQKGMDGLQHVEACSRIIRLSEGLSRTGKIGKDAVFRALGVLDQFSGKLSRYPKLHLRCVATEACRRASNAEEILESIRVETGLSFSVIDGEEEARLTAKGVSGLLDPSIPWAIIFDVGGGSTEIVFLRLNGENEPELVDWLSLPVGVVNIAESENAENAGNYFRLTSMIQERLERFGEPYEMGRLIEQGLVQLVGSSGTATTVAAVHLGLRYYDRERIDGIILDFRDVENVIKKLQMMTIEERATHPCIGPKRCDLVLGGMAVFEGLSAAWPIGKVCVADRGVRDGVVACLYEQNQHKKGSEVFIA